MVLQAHEAMDALKDNLREEHVIVYDYLTSFHQAGSPTAGFHRSGYNHEVRRA